MDDQRTKQRDTSDAVPIKRFLTYRLSRVQAKLNAQANRILRNTSGITLTQWRIIALLGAQGQSRLSDLAQDAALDKGLLSRNMKSLVDAGIVLAETDSEDHRVQNLRLSERGAEIFAKTLPVTGARQAMLRSDLSDVELELFHRVLDKLELAAER